MLDGVDDQRVGRAIRVLRQRRGWRQVDLADRAGIGQAAISKMEQGRLAIYTLGTIRLALRALGASANLDPVWGGRGDLDRVLDADHAQVVARWGEIHLRAGWELWNEASYSIYGERGRIDMLAYHPSSGTLEVAECKTGIWNVQETLGALDAKIRLAPRVAAERGWKPRRVVGAVVVLEGRTARRRVQEHASLFAPYELRGRAALSWIRRPGQAFTPSGGLLVFLSLPNIRHAGLRRAGQRRVRLRTVKTTAGVLGDDNSPPDPA